MTDPQPGVPQLMIVSADFPPSTHTSAARPGRLATYLAERGAPPSVVTLAPEVYAGEVARGRCVRDDLDAFEVLGKPCGANVPGWRRYLRYAGLVSGFRRAIRRALAAGPRPDFILWRSDPCWYLPLARIVKLHTGIPYIVDFGDLWYMQGVDYWGANAARDGLRRYGDALAEAWTVAGARMVLLTTNRQRDVLRRRYPHRPPTDFMTMRWGYDARVLATVDPCPRFDDAFQIVVFGQFAVNGPADADILARAVAVCRAVRPVRVVHMGAPEPGMVAAFDRAGVADCLDARGWVDYAQGLSVVASSDCAVVNAMSPLSHPVKVYDYIALNRPILAIAPRDTVLADRMAQFDGSFVASDDRAVVSALTRVMRGEVTELQRGLDPAEFREDRQFERLVERLMVLRDGEGAPCA